LGLECRYGGETQEECEARSSGAHEPQHEPNTSTPAG
jgi:hypothetical protein